MPASETSGPPDARAQSPRDRDAHHSDSMTTTAPNASDDSATPPAPYGTRSRGRNAAPRPNYAEDHDQDTDDLEGNVRSHPSKSSRRATGGASSLGTANVTKSDADKHSSTSRKNPVTTNTSSSSSNVPVPNKDAIPGTSSFSTNEANTTSANSRKRKQPASSSNQPSNNGNVSKKVFTTAPGVIQGDIDTNMVTFDKRGAYPKNGVLRADDGSTYAVNGGFLFFSSLFDSFCCLHLLTSIKYT